MTDLVDRARAVVAALEQHDVEAVRRLCSSRLADWDPVPWMHDTWMTRLRELAGAHRRIVEAWEVHDRMARFRMVGDVGQAYVTVLLDVEGLFGVDITEELNDGRFGIVIACSADERDALQEFYRQLVRAPLGFGEGNPRAPRWPDPAYPQQLHLDITVEDLDAAEAEVLRHGATRLQGGNSFRVFADPVGHPFCLYLGAVPAADDTEHLGVLERVVIDCPDPDVLASFWTGLLDMPVRLEDARDRVVIARSDRRLPNIGLQRVSDYHPPRWPDPDHPAQMHFDIGFDDRESRERLALQLGAIRLPPQGGSCPVYADPAGHPFCLCMTGE